MIAMRYQPQGIQRPEPSCDIARGLVAAFHGGAPLREALSGAPATSRGSAQATKGFTGGLAYDLRALNAAAYFSASRQATLLSSDQSVVFDIVINGAPAGSAPSIGGMWRSTTQGDAWLAVDRDTADTLSVNFRVGTTTANRTFGAGITALYGRRVIIGVSLTRGGTTGGTIAVRIAADGNILYDSSTTYGSSGSADVTPAGTEYISVGSESIENATRNCNATQYAQYQFARALNAADIASLSAAPWQMFAGLTDYDEVLFAAPQLVSGVLSWSEENESTTLAAVQTDSGTLAWTEAGDVVAIAATAINRAALAWAEGGDSASLIGNVDSQQQTGNTAAIAWTEGGDSMTLSGRLTDRASITATEQGDTWALAVTAATPPVISLSVRFNILPRDFNFKAVHYSN